MSLIKELYESPIKRSCFAYCEETESCMACTELLCAQANKKCPFYKTKAKLEKENKETAAKLLQRIQGDDDFRQQLKQLGITESDLRKKVESKGVSI